MDALPDRAPQPIRSRDLRWLTTETAAWTTDGIIDDTQRARIVRRYAVDVAAGERRAIAAVTGLAILAAALGVILVISYNWDAIARAAKVAIILGGVTAAFGASTVAYSRGREMTGDLLAFAGTLAHGSAIWLFAQVFHISIHYPEGMLWWAVGTLATAHLLRSRLIALGAAVLLIGWAQAEAMGVSSPNYLVLPIAALTIWLAYRVGSTWVAGLSAVALALWVGTTVGLAADGGRLALGYVALAGCGFYATGWHHADDSKFRRVWQAAGLATLAVCLGALMSRHPHELLAVGPVGQIALFVLPWPLLALAAGVVLCVIASAARHREEVSRSWPILAALVLTGVWMAILLFAPPVPSPPAFQWTMAVAFSGVTLAVGLAQLRGGMREGRGWLFLGGITYVLIFLLVRWIDLIHNMLWSAVLLMGTAAVLFAIARLWWTRQPTATAVGL
jgi:uncharacterized membrane protein